MGSLEVGDEPLYFFALSTQIEAEDSQSIPGSGQSSQLLPDGVWMVWPGIR